MDAPQPLASVAASSPPAAYPIWGRWRRFAKPFAVVLGVGVAVVAIGALSMVLHYVRLSDFATYVREVRAEESVHAPLPAGAEILSKDGVWSVGAEDPFALEEKDRNRFDFEVAISHGDDSLLQLKVQTAYTFVPDWHERTSLAIRALRLETAPDMRALVRVGVPEPERVLGPEAPDFIVLTFDVFLLAGAGPSELQVVRHDSAAKAKELEELAKFRSTGDLFWRALNPAPNLPPEGLAHHVRTRVRLPDAPSQSIGIHPVDHSITTREYSFAVEAKTTGSGSKSGGFSRSSTHSQRLTWMGKVW